MYLGGWINHKSRGLIQEIWEKCKFVKRKKCKKRRCRKGNHSFIAAQYKLRCHSIKKKYHIHDALDLNFDESLVPIVPEGKYTMETKGKNSIYDKNDEYRMHAMEKISYFIDGYMVFGVDFFAISICDSDISTPKNVAL